MKLANIAPVLCVFALASCTSAPVITPAAPLVYVNQNFGFDVPGYKYQQAEIPCDIQPHMVQSLIHAAAEKNIRLEAVSAPDKINNKDGIPLLAIDIVGLVLGGEGRQFGVKTDNELPAIIIKAAVFGNDAEKSFQVKAHSCAILTLNELTPSTNVLDLGTVATVCSATKKCVDQLSNDLVTWLAPLVKK
jgi:hypothetical protein